jgi:cell shape-determining protein MreC
MGVAIFFMTHTSPSRRTLMLTLVVVAVFGLLPIKVTSWARHLGVVPDFVIAPISHPLTKLGGVFSREGRGKDESAELRAMKRERDVERLRADQAEEEVRRLAKLLEQFKVMAEMVQDQPPRQIPAPVYASPSDLGGKLLRVRAGAREGVIENSVVVATGLQLVGKVVEVSSRTCGVLPITSKGAGGLRGVVILEKTGNVRASITGERLECQLDAVGNGTLRGPVTYRVDSTGVPIKAEVGQVVRLYDDSWPRSAQYLTVGVVEAVDPSPSSLQRQIITVRPTIQRLESVKEVIVRVPIAPGDELKEGGRS